MSSVEDLKDLVAGALEKKGVLNRIRAELRASVFASIQEQNSVDLDTFLANSKIGELNNDFGILMASLVNEFLQFYDLDFTRNVFCPEANVDGKLLSYGSLRQRLEGEGISTDGNAPLLSHLLKNALAAKGQGGTAQAASPVEAAVPKPVYNESSKASPNVAASASTATMASPPPAHTSPIATGSPEDVAPVDQVSSPASSVESEPALAEEDQESASVGDAGDDQEAPTSEPNPSVLPTVNIEDILRAAESKTTTRLGGLPPLGGSLPPISQPSLPPLDAPAKQADSDKTLPGGEVASAVAATEKPTEQPAVKVDNSVLRTEESLADAQDDYLEELSDTVRRQPVTKPASTSPQEKKTSPVAFGAAETSIVSNNSYESSTAEVDEVVEDIESANSSTRAEEEEDEGSSSPVPKMQKHLRTREVSSMRSSGNSTDDDISRLQEIEQRIERLKQQSPQLSDATENSVQDSFGFETGDVSDYSIDSQYASQRFDAVETL